MSWRSYLFSFEGRINRARIWFFYVVAWVIELALFLGVIAAYAVLSASGIVKTDALSDETSVYPGIVFTIVLAICFLTIFYMYLAVMVKRLHDRNRNGLWVVAFFVIPAILIFTPPLLTKTRFISEDGQADRIAAACAGLIGTAIYIWGFVELYCLRGTLGENRYGPDLLG